MLTLTILALLVVALTARLCRRFPADGGESRARWLDSPIVVVAVFLVTVAVLDFVWAGVARRPNVHDELAYVLQAEIFATGRWALPSPVMPQFFEQPYVLVEPVLASKYFPGHSLLLALGALVGWMPLVPLLLQGVAGSLVFVLARRVSSGGVAVFAWTFWLFTPMVLRFGPSFFSQATTTVCWLAGWYALLEWHHSRRRGWLLAVAVCTGWCVITRPLTGLAYAIPVGVFVCLVVVRERRWRDLALALAAGVAVLAIIPLWSARTTGDWRVTPLQRYTEDYMPFDLPGFGLDSTPPARTLNPQFVELNKVYRQWHPDHQPARLPGILAERAQYLGGYIFGWSRGLMIPFAVIGLLVLRGPALFAAASSILLLLVYLCFGTPPHWALYYYESAPAYAFLTAVGVAWMAAWVGNGRRLPSGAPSSWPSLQWAPALMAGIAMFGYPHYVAMRRVSHQRTMMMAPFALFERTRTAIPAARAVLFVRYSPGQSPHETFVRNVVDPDRERVLVVHDRGEAENAGLLALMPDRTPYTVEEPNERAPAGTAPSPSR